MSGHESSLNSEDSQPGIFPETRWSLILCAQDNVTTEKALSDLCQIYWYLVYCFVRSRGHSPEDAEDLTQSFFQRLLSKQLFERADSERGRLRSFLLRALKDHLIDSRRWNLAQKRGGGMKPLSFDQVAAEERFLLEPASAQTPADLFERAWASIAINKALGHLRKSYADEGKIHIYDKLQTYMSGNDADGHGQLAEELGWNPMSLS